MKRERELPELSLVSIREAWRSSQEEVEPTPAAPDMPKKKGVGRWLKKHWYVPVIAGVLLGGLILDDDDDDDNEDSD